MSAVAGDRMSVVAGDGMFAAVGVAISGGT